MSVTKSCLNCPSLLDADEAMAFFGLTEVGAPMCSRFGHVLGHLGNSVVYDDAADKLATGCSSFGQPKPSAPPQDISANWYTPRPELLEVTTDTVLSCDSCANFDSALHACAASGRIIFPERRVKEAYNCSWSRVKNPGAPQEQAGPVLTGYGQATTVFIRNAGATVTQKQQPVKKASTLKPRKVTEPFDYDSDAPVTDDHKTKGIRAWRKHTTERGKVYYLPIFESSFFGERASLIPSSKSEHGDPSLYIDHAGLLDEFAVQVYKKDLNLVMVGEPGSGKTEGWRFVAWMVNMPFTRLSYNEASEPDMFLGLYEFDPAKGTYLNPGLLPTSWELPGFILSDEPNLAPEAIMQSYRSMNDSSRTLTVYKEEYKRHDYCFHAMAINPHWDFRNIGAKPLASADSRRLSFMWMPNPSTSQLREIISNTVLKLDGEAPPKALLDIIIKIGEDLRRMSKEGTLPDFWTVSQEIKVARLVDDFGIEGAYRRAYFNYIAPEDAESAMASIKSHVPYGSDWA